MNSIAILYENDEILVINKPAGLAVQGGNGISHSLDKDFSEQLGYKIFLVHRLDKDTSGLMIVAKSSFAANKWTKLIGGKAAKKEYVALCAGRLKNKSGIIKDDLIQHGENKNAVTHYEVIQEWDYKIENPVENQPDSIPLCLIKLQLETGRMHQIRIHLAKQNCPIAGDDQHGNFKLNKLLRKTLKIKRLMLCSQRLTLPENGKELVFELPLPEDFPVSSII